MAESTSEEESFIARRTESVDAEGVFKLLTRTSEAIFGRINIDHLTWVKYLVCIRTLYSFYWSSEHANFSVSLVSGSGSDELLGLLSLVDYPPPHGCAEDAPAASWEQWMHSSYSCPKASVGRASWIRSGLAKTISWPSTCPSWNFSDGHGVVTLKSAIVLWRLPNFVYQLCFESPTTIPLI